MSGLEHLIEQNRAWARQVTAREPNFFERQARNQSPSYLWIGCSDSRVSSTKILGLSPGELFVHRNVGNLVVHTDLNCLSVLQYALEVLRLEHVIVCGHYGCGGVAAALRGDRHGLIDNWLRHVQDVAIKHRPLLNTLPEGAAREDLLCELNVIEQVVNAARTTVIEEAWGRGQTVTVHGWLYDIQDGLVRDLGLDVSSAEDIDGALEDALAAAAGRPRGPCGPSRSALRPKERGE